MTARIPGATPGRNYRIWPPSKVAAMLIVDEEDRHLLKAYRWSLDQHGYALLTNHRTGKMLKLHHAILPPKPGFEVDHINGNTLDNRRANLRYTTPSENRQNSGADGVSWNASCRKWQAQAHINKRQFYLGVFARREDAVAAAREFRIKNSPGYIPRSKGDSTCV